MRIPLRWLREHVRVLPETQAVVAALVRLGHEVEGITSLRAGLQGVVVGQILRVDKHPNADRLHLLQVSTGPGEPVGIVCGAPNVQEGAKVAVALPGAELAGGLRIAKARIRGVESAGMCCSLAELGLGEEAGGIWLLPDEAPVGEPLADWLGLDETILELSITPNRGDCMSVRGIARELAADFGLSLSALVEAHLPADLAPLSVEITDEGCAFYAALRMEGIPKGARSPLWLQMRLREAGMRPVHGVVDVLNYLMLDLGQPMHAFDAARLALPLSVRAAREGEALEGLDGRRYALAKGDLVVVDARGVQALAGVLGAAGSAVNDATTSVVIESAFFAPERVSLTRQRLGIVSEAGLRFERGVDPLLVRYALARAARMLQELFGARPVAYGEAGDLAPLAKPRTVHALWHRITERLGFVPPERTDETLGRMGFRVRRHGDALAIEVPPYRRDVQAWWDIAEEYGRIAGLEDVPSTPLLLPPQPAPAGARRRAVDAAVEAGAREVVLLAFSSPARERLFTADDGKDLVLANPLSERMGILRRSLLPQLVAAAAENLRRGARAVRLVEEAKVYWLEDGRAVEEPRLGWCYAGLAQDDEWFAKARPVDFFDLKGALEHFFARLGVQARFVPDDEILGLEPGQSARIVADGHTIGMVGRVSEEAAKALELEAPAFAAEIVLARLPAPSSARFVPAPEYPAIVRDLVVLAPRTVQAAALVEAARRGAGALCETARVFDRYVGEKIPADKVSIGIRLVLRAPDRTLTQEEAEAAVARALAELEKLGASLRTV